ncbi:MAG: ABC transporter permease [Bacteroidota bacterium]
MAEKYAYPPKWSLWLVKLLIRTDLLEEIEGNLYQYYRELLQAETNWPKVRYGYQVLCFLRWGTVKHVQFKNSRLMFHFDPKVAIRNLAKHRVSTTINLLGFVVGLVSVFFLYFYIRTELRVDSFHENGDSIYRVLRINSSSGEKQYIGVSNGPMGKALINDFPNAITSLCRVDISDNVIEIEEDQYPDQRTALVDDNFFTFFSYPLAVGDPESVLEADGAVVISAEQATLFFGDEDPIGKNLHLEGDGPFVVTGILGEPAAGSSMEFDMVFCNAPYVAAGVYDHWWHQNLTTFVQLGSPEMEAELEAQFPAFMDKYLADDFAELGFRNDIVLEPLPEIYFNGTTDYDFHIRHGNRQSVNTLIFVALAILFIACFNYVNLAIAQAYQRAKEVGVRKVLGVARGRLIMQFLGESLLITGLAVLVSVLVTISLKSMMLSWFGLNFTFDWLDPTVLTFISGLLLAVVLTSGLYPALLLSGFQPLQVFRPGKLNLGKSLLVRKGLVITQFSLSIFLVIVTLLVGLQIRYVKTKDLGYDREAVLLVDIYTGAIWQQRDQFQERVALVPGVKYVTGNSGEPGGFHDNFVLKMGEGSEDVKCNTVFADPYYLSTFDIRVAAGRGFNPESVSEDTTVMMINESALKASGLTAEEVIGQKVQLPTWDMERTVVGIVEDYHFTSLHKDIAPLVIVMADEARQFALKLEGNNLAETVAAIEAVYQEIDPEYPMEYAFQDENLAQMYLQEDQQARLFTAFSGLSILLACMGIFGLAAFAAQRRQKELGIRKILGASVQQMIGLISREFLWLVALASVVAIPTAWYFLQQWLMSFAYRIQLTEQWFVFLLGSLLAGGVALLTIGMRTYHAAVRKPTESIKSE